MTSATGSADRYERTSAKAARVPQDLDMVKRALGTLLWFLAGWMGGGLIVSLVGLPTPLGLLPGILIAALVAWDPRGAIWSRPRPDKRVVRPINDFAAELDKDASRAAAESDRIRV